MCVCNLVEVAGFFSVCKTFSVHQVLKCKSISEQFSFCTPWKHRKTLDFLVFARGKNTGASARNGLKPV